MGGCNGLSPYQSWPTTKFHIDDDILFDGGYDFIWGRIINKSVRLDQVGQVKQNIQSWEILYKIRKLNEVFWTLTIYVKSKIER